MEAEATIETPTPTPTPVEVTPAPEPPKPKPLTAGEAVNEIKKLLEAGGEDVLVKVKEATERVTHWNEYRNIISVKNKALDAVVAEVRIFKSAGIEIEKQFVKLCSELGSTCGMSPRYETPKVSK